MKKCVVFGATGYEDEFWDKVCRDYKVIALTDNDEKKWGKVLMNLNVLSPLEAVKLEVDCFVINSVSALYVIKEQLINLGVPEGNIILKYYEPQVVARIAFLENYSRYIKNKLGTDLKKYKVAEGGVFQGEFSKEINKNFPNNELFLFDTFEGFDERDVEVEKKEGYSNANKGYLSITSEELVINKMKYPQMVNLKKGYFPETTKGLENNRFVYVNLDFDLHNPTLEGLRWFWPRMINGGIITIHDYFAKGYDGINEAINLFIKEYPETNNLWFPIGDGNTIGLLKS